MRKAAVNSKGEQMYGTLFAIITSTLGANPDLAAWELDCNSPNELVVNQARTRSEMPFPIPGSPVRFQSSKRPWLEVSLAPDFITFEDGGYHSGQSYSFSNVTSARGFKGQILKRLGLMEVRARGFGATLRFASAPNWAFQLKGTNKLTVAYITRF